MAKSTWLWELKWVVKVSVFCVHVSCLVLKCLYIYIYMYISFFLAVVFHLWWHKCLFCNVFGLIQCGLWWVSQQYSCWSVTIRDIECPLYGFFFIVHAGSVWMMVFDGFVWTVAFIGPITVYKLILLKLYSLTSVYIQNHILDNILFKSCSFKKFTHVLFRFEKNIKFFKSS